MPNWGKYLLTLLVFLIPTNLSLHWYTREAYFNGALIDYMLPKLYLSDLVAFSLIFISLPRLVKLKVPKPLLIPILLLFLYLGIRGLTVPFPISHFWYVGKLLEYALLLLSLKTLSRSALVSSLYQGLITAGIFQSLIALAQYIKQGSLFGYYFLGEPNLNLSASIAKQLSSGALRLLPYGTTPHPNVLAGFLAFSLVTIIIIKHLAAKKFTINITEGIFISFIITVLLLTESVSALLSISIVVVYVIGYCMFSKPRKDLILRLQQFSILFILLIIGMFIYHSQTWIDSASIDRRYKLFSTGIMLLSTHPLTGVGLNHSIIESAKIKVITLPAPFLQPVHNIYLIWLVETGLIGAAITIAIFQALKLPQKLILKPPPLVLPLLLLMMIGVLDHYPLTLQSGQLMLTIGLFIALLPTSKLSKAL